MELKENQLFIKITRWLIIFMVVIIPIQVTIFLVSPMPETTFAWFSLFKENPLMGMLHMDLLYIINNTFLIFFYFALYLTLKRKENSLLNIALITGMVGAVLYYASNRSIEMLYISQSYFKTTDLNLQAQYLLIGESYLDIWKGTSFNIYYVLSAISLLLFSYVMLKDSFYSKKTAWIGLISGILMIVPSSVGMLGLVMSLLSLIPWIIFSILVTIRLFELDEK
jgi:hypothetical protein